MTDHMREYSRRQFLKVTADAGAAVGVGGNRRRLLDGRDSGPDRGADLGGRLGGSQRGSRDGGSHRGPDGHVQTG